MADYADDLASHSYQVEIDTLAEGILGGKCLPLKFLINDHSTGTSLVVCDVRKRPRSRGIRMMFR
jgi:hypothetical protein